MSAVGLWATLQRLLSPLTLQILVLAMRFVH